MIAPGGQWPPGAIKKGHDLITIQNCFNTAIVFSEGIDPGAAGLLRALCGSPISQNSKIRVMPDVHAGKGCAVGMTMTISDCVAPGLIGPDIGCGMTVFKVGGRRPELQKLDKTIREAIPAGCGLRTKIHRFSEQIDLKTLNCSRHIQEEKAMRCIGTLGGGNHFIELDQSRDGSFWLIIHSGSRNLGAGVANFYQKAAFDSCPEGTPYELAYMSGALMADYLHDIKIVQAYAELNRRAIASDIVKRMKWDVELAFSTVHNYVDADCMVLRKGAVSARQGEQLIIPMNMRDGCLLCVGKGNREWNESAPHGAGRLMSRAEARQRFTLSQFKKEMDGVYSSSLSHDTIDESPMAYKPMEQILAQIGPSVEIKEHIRPVYNFKACEK